MNVLEVEKYDNYLIQLNCYLGYLPSGLSDVILALEGEEFEKILDENKHKEFLKRAILFGRKEFIDIVIKSKIREYDRILCDNENLTYRQCRTLFNVYKEIIESRPTVSASIADVYYILMKECNSFNRNFGLEQQKDQILKSIIHDVKSI